VTWVDRAIGKFKLSLASAVTATLPESGYYDILVTDSLGASYYWLRGQATLDLGYTE
jgi:hypothetical protein